MHLHMPTNDCFCPDIDEASIQNAQMNIESNNLQNRITITAATSGGPILLPLSLDSSSTFVRAIHQVCVVLTLSLSNWI
jgi:23S rRNA A1618 N6-methylase RlmF